MASYNRVILVGNLTRDPEIKYIPSGTPVCEVGLALNERYKNTSGEWVEDVTFVEVTLWARTAEVASEYLSKGSPVLIEGRLKLDTWENKEGQKQSKLRVVCQRMQMLGGRGAGAGPAGEGGPRQAPRRDNAYSQSTPGPSRDESEAPPMEPPADDIPF
jgi:single-strand DNA-binding protein